MRYGMTDYDSLTREELVELLTDRERVFNASLEKSMAGFWDWNLRDNTEYLSPTFKSMFGYEDHELKNVPETWMEIIFEEDLPGVLKVFEQHVASKGKVPYSNTVRYHHKDGSTVHVYCRGEVIEWNGDEPVRMVGTHVDITELMAAQQQMQEQVQLTKEKSQALDNFLRSVSHDLKSPVASNIAMLTMLQEEDDLSEVHRFVRMGLQRMKGLNRFVDDIITYRKNNTLETSYERIDLPLAIEEVLQLTDFIEDYQDIATRVEVAEGLPAFYCDPFRVRTILSNLVGNALKYHKNGTAAQDKVVTVRASALANPTRLQLQVEDNGQGIREEYLDYIWEPFKTANEEKQGSGLGLAIVKETVEKLRGTVKVESVFGQFTRFTVELPLDAPAGAPEGSTTTGRKPKPKSTTPSALSAS